MGAGCARIVSTVSISGPFLGKPQPRIKPVSAVQQIGTLAVLAGKATFHEGETCQKRKNQKD